MELEPRTTAPAHATGAVVFLPIDALDPDATFRLREEGDVAALAASIGRLGQLEPIEVRAVAGDPGTADRYQVVAGFRRVAALRLLLREEVLARVHERLDDEDAWAIALAAPLVAEPLLASELAALRPLLEAGPAARWAPDLLDDALARAPVDPAQRERFQEFLRAAETRRAAAGAGGAEQGAEDDAEAAVEVTPDELADDLAARLWAVNQDLAVAAEAWGELPAEGRRALLDQLRWIAALLSHLEQR